MTKFYYACEEASLSILVAIEEALELPNGAFQNKCQPHSASELRLNHYPAISIEQMRSGSTGRVFPHFDLGVITLLFTDNAGGLEFQDRNHSGSEVFTPVEPASETEMILNISETMQRWTHDHLPAGLHRVTVPQDLQSQTTGTLPERHSIAYFCKAMQDTSVGPLPQFVKGQTSKYEDLTALEYHQKRLVTAYQ